MSSWKTTIFGGLAGVFGYLASSGVTIGHIGKVTGAQALAALFTTLFGYYAKDKNVTGAQ